MVEGAEGADYTAQGRHRMRVAAEYAKEGRKLLVHHRVAADGVGELLQFGGGRQFAVEQQIADLHEAGMFGKLADRIAAVEQHALVAVDIGQLRFTTRGDRKRVV